MIKMAHHTTLDVSCLLTVFITTIHHISIIVTKIQAILFRFVDIAEELIK